MAKTLTGTATAGIQYTYTNADDVGSTIESKNVRNNTGYDSGKAANQADVLYRTQVTVTSGSPNQDLDLYGSLLDIFGDTLNFEYIKAILVRNLSTTAGDNIYVGPLGLSNPFSEPWAGASAGAVQVNASGAFLIEAPLDGYNVETTAQNLRIQYQGTSGSISVQIVIMGASGDLESSSSSSSSSSSQAVSSSSSSSSSAALSSSSSSSSSSSVAVYSSSSSSSSASESSSSSSQSSVSVSTSSSSSSSTSSASSQG